MFHGIGAVRIACQSFLRGIDAQWVLYRNALTTPIRTGRGEPQLDHTFLLEVDTRQLEPGFYDLSVTIALSDTESVSARTTFGWSVFQEPSIFTCPNDFAQFWQHAHGKVNTTPVDLNIQPNCVLTKEEIGRYNLSHAALPQSYDPDAEVHEVVELYHVDFASPAGGRVYGSFAKPAGSGPFPGLLVLPGAGNTPRPAPVEHARHGYAALDIQVHGHKVDAQSYPPLPDLTYTEPEEYLYYGVYLNALQGVRALERLPSVAPDQLAAIGGSQGGRLSLVVASLDPRIRAVVAAVTHFGYVPWTRWVRKMNEERCAGERPFSESDVIYDSQTRVDSYFDVANFAPYLRCPILMNCGLIDPVSPPTTIYQIYRQIISEKKIVPLPNTAHDWCPKFDRYAWRWMAEQLPGTATGHHLIDPFGDPASLASGWL